ncbi:N-acetyl-D-Glu racemase DgcA [Terrarubrum flagellatum]|uniref:N-acetyl-D-Glu racemase DgcA n=1 Tax=Terrirubrum flagellatum TaxID=2895980 RepID=UPI0031454302
MPQLEIAVERWPIAAPFTIARGSKTEAIVVVATISDGRASGRGECVPYPRYGETPESVVAQIEAIRGAIEASADRDALQTLMPAGAARNAVDCALWDYDAKRLGVRAADMAGVGRVRPAVTAYTLSLADPDVMGAAAAKAADRPVLKIKLGGGDGRDPARLAAVRRGAPDAMLLVDANEGWSAANLSDNLTACADAGVTLVEQPLPVAEDEALRDLPRPVPICADESVHGRDTLDRLIGLYDLINIKLDKTGGLTEALALADAAQARDFGLFIGCMVGTSLGMAPAMLLAPKARFVDLDGPLLLARDREPALRYEGSIAHPPEPALWG